MQKDEFVERLLFSPRLFATIVFPAALAKVFENLALLPRHMVRESLFLLPTLEPFELSFKSLFSVSAEFFAHGFVMNLGAGHPGRETLLETLPRIPRLKFKQCDFPAHAHDQCGHCEQSKLLESFEARAELQNWLK